MYLLSLSKATGDITSIIPCSLTDYRLRYKGKSTETVEYEWIDHSAFSDSTEIGMCLSHPEYFTLLRGRDPSDNRLIMKSTASAMIWPLPSIMTGSDQKFTIPKGAKYLVIKAFVAAGGRGSNTIRGGCGASVTNVVIDVNGAMEYTVYLGERGTSFAPNAKHAYLMIDGNTIYKLAGGMGSDANGNLVPVDLDDPYEPTAGSGGYWVLSLGGSVFNGNYRSTTGVVKSYGGGGDYNQDGQPALLDAYFTDLRPSIDGPLLSNRRIPIVQNSTVSYNGDPVTLSTGTKVVPIPDGYPYLCVMSACAGGGYGRNTTGGQGAYMSATWYACYGQRPIVFTVGRGGSIDSDPDGGQTSISYHDPDQNATIPITILDGGKTTGVGGYWLVGSGSNIFDGRDRTSSSPRLISGPYGGGGPSGHAGQDGTLTYVFCSSAPAGVEVYDTLEDPLYDKRP